MRGVKRGGIGVFAGWASGLVASSGGLRLAQLQRWALPCGRRRRCPVVGPWWLPREVVLMVQRSDFVRKKIDFSESCTTKRRRTAVGCCKLVDASRGPLQVCSLGARDPAPTGVQALGQAALCSPLPLAHTHRARPRAETGRARRRRARRGSGGRCGGVSGGSERAGERK